MADIDVICPVYAEGQGIRTFHERLSAALEAIGDIVQAIRNDGRDVAALKRMTSRWFYQTFMSVGSVELKSGAADFRLLSRKVVDVFRLELREHSPFVRGLVSWVGFNVRYVP